MCSRVIEADGRCEVMSGGSLVILLLWEMDLVTRLLFVVERFRCSILVVCGGVCYDDEEAVLFHLAFSIEFERKNGR